MKKQLFLSALMAVSTLTAEAQVQMYTVKTTHEPYVELIDATVIASPADDEELLGTYWGGIVVGNDYYYNEFEDEEGLPIGFDFNFGGETMNQFMVGTDGIVFLGKDQMSVSHQDDHLNVFYSQSESTSGQENILGMTVRANSYAIPTTSISYKLEGEAPNRVLVIQYKDFLLNSQLRSTPDENVAVSVGQIQYRLYEADGTVSMQFSGFQPNADIDDPDGYLRGMWAYIGLRGHDNDAVMLTNRNGETTAPFRWDARMELSGSNYPDGTYTFAAPTDCVIPTAGPTDLTIKTGIHTIDGTFIPAENADHYMVLLSSEGYADTMPKDFFKYTVGNKLGNAEVAALISINTNEPVFNLIGLQADTHFYVTVVAYNANGLNGPRYNVTDVAKADAITQAMPEMTVPYSWMVDPDTGAGFDADVMSLWMPYQGTLATPTILSAGGDITIDAGDRWTAASVRYESSDDSELACSWLVSPLFILDASKTYTVSVSALCFERVWSWYNREGKLSLVLARDGKTFNEADVIASDFYPNEQSGMEEGEYTNVRTVSGTINNTEGKVSIGIYISTDTTAQSPLSFFLYKFNIEEDTMTGIETTDNVQAQTLARVHDLQGRPVAQPTHGLYIIDGHKVAVK